MRKRLHAWYATTCVVIVIVSMVLLTAGCGSSAGWTDTGGGLRSHDVVSFAYDDTHDLLYAGTPDHGVWRCENPRTSPRWKNIGGGLDTYGVFALAYDGKHDVLYAGGIFASGGSDNSDLRGVWRCDNPRTSPKWIDTGGQISSCFINALVYEPVHNVLYAGTDQGVWRASSPEEDATWINTGGPLSSIQVNSLEYDRERDTLYAGTSGVGVWYCPAPDTNSSWSSTGGDFNGASVDALAYDSRRDIIYAGIGGTGVRRCKGTRSAPSWTSMARKLIAADGPNAASSLAYDPASDLLFMGGYEAGALYSNGKNGGVWCCKHPESSDSWTIFGMSTIGISISSLICLPTRHVIFAGMGFSARGEGRGVWRHELP